MEVLRSVLKDVVENGDKVIEQENEDERRGYYRKSCGDLIKIKSHNRQIYLSLEDQRNELEAKKNVVDKLKLTYENLLYKQAYLQREIRACKDLATPTLSEIEKELGQTLATHEYSAQLSEVNSRALELLEQERVSRVETEKVLDSLKEKRNEALKTLDRKRKFLDEVPSKVEVISALAKELDTQFTAHSANNDV